MGDPFDDYAGRMQTMTNWSSVGSVVTTWVCDPQRRWLNNKVYADGNGPSYAYTPAGRLQTTELLHANQ